MTDDHLVHEAVGPSLHPLAAAACLAVGVNALMVIGVLPVLLGTLADEHRLTAAGIGQSATIELLAMGLSTGAMGVVRRPNRLRAIAMAASLGLALANAATLVSSGVGIFAARAAAGALEGVLIWISVAMIARTVTPERWAGVFFTAQTASQLVLAILIAVWLAPRWGANGGYAVLAMVALTGMAMALALPDRLAPLVSSTGQSGAPPLRGLAALAATLVYVSAAGAVAVYVVPMAHQSGLGSDVARTGQWVNLSAQVAGAALATLMAGRVGYLTVFVAASSLYLTAWFLLSKTLPGGAFIAVYASTGLAGLLVGPFLTPMTIDADPSRRAAMQSGAAQILGGAMGPFLASLAVGRGNVHGVLLMGAGLMLAGLAGFAALRFTHRRA